MSSNKEGIPADHARQHSAMSWASITADDDTELVPRPRGVLVTVAGNLNLTGNDDVDVPIPVNANTVYPFRPKKIKSTSTTATGIIAFY